MRVFVTGATGLVGRHVTQQLVARGDSVLALARSAEAEQAVRSLGAEPLRGDLSDAAVLTRGVAAADATVHAAAVVLGRASDWRSYERANVSPTERLAEVCARERRRLVHLSSVAVYGRRSTYQGGPRSVSEDFGLDRPLFAGDHYARSKREAELAVWRAVETAGLSAVALRPCVIYGEGDRNFAPRVARALSRGLSPVIGTGGNALSVVYAGNVATAVLGALDRPQVTGAFNTANDGELTQRAFLERFAAGLGVQVRWIPVPRALAWNAARLSDGVLRLLAPRRAMSLLKSAVQFLGSDNPYVSDKARTELGWMPPIAAADAVERTGRWFREEGNAKGE